MGLANQAEALRCNPLPVVTDGNGEGPDVECDVDVGGSSVEAAVHESATIDAMLGRATDERSTEAADGRSWAILEAILGCDCPFGLSVAGRVESALVVGAARATTCEESYLRAALFR